MIVTPYGHVLYTKMLPIARRFVSAYCATGGGGGGGEGYSSAHAHMIMCDPLPVVQAACRVRRNRTFSAVGTVLLHGRMFQGSDKV